ncbi:glycoside hydrolase family 43 protein [Aerococcaceae bacterium zg-BR9]|uniref:glycoside hydrolase family 43 protein n=1 Tax=Aerococcaceae bacterium zg-1292 TaxID=2774330 RepID=UPI00406356FD|nr:glycoside hydrolase family 43 protein [Aerococcaceae bacterium zg-BR9]
MKKRLLSSLCILLISSSVFPQINVSANTAEFKNVSVHDPSIIETDNQFYIIGSHAAFAKSEDLVAWNQISTNGNNTKLFENIKEELAEDFKYAKTDTLWASDIIQLKDGKYYLYYCLCEGSSPLSVLGVAVSDKIEGPYKKIESFLYSGTGTQFGKFYDATKHPNVIDPHVFYDSEGKLWMVYGSYSGGIYILEMDEETGLPIDRNTYGTHLAGGNHSRIEAPYIQYNKETGYYYLFTSFGGLDAQGGYNIRVSRSKKPNGPYEDIQGNIFSNIKGKYNTLFDDISIQGFGVKLVGNFSYVNDTTKSSGYVSPGHNSTYYDPDLDAYFLIFHTRFPHAGELHEVRVHQLHFLENGWPVMSPQRYNGKLDERVDINSFSGTFKVIQMDKLITDNIAQPKGVNINNQTIIGEGIKGEIVRSNNDEIIIRLEDGKEYSGILTKSWDDLQKAEVVNFTGLSNEGEPIFIVEVEE